MTALLSSYSGVTVRVVQLGAIYVLDGVLARRRPTAGRWLADGIALLNALVVVGCLYVSGGPVAVPSVRAMALRTGVWVLLFGGLVWLGRRRPSALPSAR